MREAVHEALVGAVSLEVVQADKEVVLRNLDGGARTVESNGKKKEELGVSTKARWQDGRLVVETETRALKIQEAYAIDAGQGLLRVEVHAKHRRLEGEVKLKRVYRKTDAPRKAG